MKKFTSFLAVMLCFMGLSAQNAVVPAGGTATGNSGTVTYTVGQMAVQRMDNGDKSVLEGVQQPYEIQTVGVDNFPNIALEAVLYPNPTTQYVQLRIHNYDFPSEGLRAQLYDGNGRLLRIFTVADEQTHIDLSEYAAANYQLRILDGQQLLKTFKVVKLSW